MRKVLTVKTVTGSTTPLMRPTVSCQPFGTRNEIPSRSIRAFALAPSARPESAAAVMTVIITALGITLTVRLNGSTRSHGALGAPASPWDIPQHWRTEACLPASLRNREPDDPLRARRFDDNDECCFVGASGRPEDWDRCVSDYDDPGEVTDLEWRDRCPATACRKWIERPWVPSDSHQINADRVAVDEAEPLHDPPRSSCRNGQLGWSTGRLPDLNRLAYEPIAHVARKSSCASCPHRRRGKYESESGDNDREDPHIADDAN